MSILCESKFKVEPLFKCFCWTVVRMHVDLDFIFRVSVGIIICGFVVANYFSSKRSIILLGIQNKRIEALEAEVIKLKYRLNTITYYEELFRYRSYGDGYRYDHTFIPNSPISQ